MNIPSLTQTRLLPLTRIRRERMLPTRGEVTLSIGSRVDPLDVVARASSEAHLYPVPLARYMHVSESALPKYLLKKSGDLVAPREIIASKPELMGTLQRIYRAPGSGRIAAIQGSWLVVELDSAPIELRALYRGNVVDLMPNRGIVIEAVGLVVQGAWGGGGEGYGVLKKVAESPSDVLAEEKVDVSARGAVLLAGAGITEQALRRAAQERVAGIIVGGLLPQLKELVETLRIPVLVTEAFGEHPIVAPIFNLLSSRNGEEATVNTATRTRGGAMRPEVFIPTLSAMGAPLEVPPMAELAAEAGATVRVLRSPHMGAVGKIVSVPKLPQVLESGISAWGAEIELTGGEQVFVPWLNLELIG
ncbi:MAG TPA: hypothetical protein VF932_11095 [Anaerolineae bacterium]